MSKKIDLTGQKIGKLTVIEKTVNPNVKNKRTYWKCKCECGNESIVDTTSLSTRRIKQCWECAHYETNLHKRKDYTGERFGKLVVLQMKYPDRLHKNDRTQVICQCECGNTVIREIEKVTQSLKDGYIPSCGCHRKERAQELAIDVIGKKYGKLVPLYYVNQGRRLKAMCQCDCGKTKLVAKADLLSGTTKSCGCLHREIVGKVNQVDHTGQISEYGVRIIKQSFQNKRGVWVWDCECGLCGGHFYEIPARVLNGHIRHCPQCTSRSSTEDYIESILKEHSVKYKREKRFPDCRNIYPLPFDFAILDKDKSIKCLLEYDGQQHYKPISFFGGEEAFIIRKNNDLIKDKYCKDNNIPLIRLPYYLSVEEIKKTIMNII